MPLQILCWLAGILVVPAVAWAFWVTQRLNYIKSKADKLEYMHYNPDKYGFGSRELTRQSYRLAHWMRATAHWTKWAAEQATGKEAPPLPPDPNDIESEDTLTPPYGDEAI